MLAPEHRTLASIQAVVQKPRLGVVSLVHTPIRMCVACRSRRPQRDLVRIARTPDGVEVDPGVGLPGRGAYVCPDPRCVERAAKRGARQVRRALRDADDRQVEAALEEIARRVGLPSGKAQEAADDTSDGVGPGRRDSQHFDRDKRQVTST